jgi:polysaccharide deacetylase 2 family uncharacterized protein YibQ
VQRIFFFLLTCALSLFATWLTGCDKAKSSSSSRITTPHLAHPSGNHAAKLAIILDDVGGDASEPDAIFALPSHMTLSILPNHPRSTEIANEAHDRGYEVMLHLPMESEANESPESQQLRTGMGKSEVSRILDEMLTTVPRAVGVNNHQGSRATSDDRLMEELMSLLQKRHLFFIDSRTTTATVAYDVAQRDDVRSGFRNVPFLDDVQQQSAIRQQFEHAIRGAQEKGEAIVIGHPHPATLQVLRQMLPQLPALGVELVHASALVHRSASH